jgi:glycosyltransferase involved in cell wall biosynthesis
MQILTSSSLIATPSETQPAILAEPRGCLWVFLASLSRGGAERIVLDWLQDAVRRGHRVCLVVQHQVENEWPVPPGVTACMAPADFKMFILELASDIKETGMPVHCHLIRDEYLEVLWASGVQTVPTVHNARAGWRNDPKRWTLSNVPFVIAVSNRIGEELVQHGCQVPVVVIRHRPKVSSGVFSEAQRQAVRARYHIGPDELFIGMVGSIKEQKNYVRALHVLAQLQTRRSAKLLIAGGLGGREGAKQLRAIAEEGARLGLSGSVFLPGFVSVEEFLPAFDVVLNTSDFEGFSIAVQEALLAGLPVVASRVGGQDEIEHEALALVDATDVVQYTNQLARLPVREALSAGGCDGAMFDTARLWQLAAECRGGRDGESDVLFVTANLNAGGAQRSLVNLTTQLCAYLHVAVAVTGRSTQDFFHDALRKASVTVFRTTESRNVLDIAETLIAYLAKHPTKTLCFWNLDPKLKLLLTKFLPSQRIIDVSPGHYAFLEMGDTLEFQKALAFSENQYYQALDSLVLKFSCSEVPSAVADKVTVIPNGVPEQLAVARQGLRRLVVQGRIAPSKQLEVVLEAARIAQQTVPFTLCIYGQAEASQQEYLSAVLAQAASNENVVFLGARPDLVKELGQFDGAVVLGKHQGCPNAVLEALAAGIPVVANDSGGTRELITQRTGILLPEDVDEYALADAMVTLLSMDATALRNAAREKAQEFSMAKMVEGYKALFSENSNV